MPPPFQSTLSLLLYASDLLSVSVEKRFSLSLCNFNTFDTSYLDFMRYNFSVVDPDMALVPVIWSDPFEVVTVQSAV